MNAALTEVRRRLRHSEPLTPERPSENYVENQPQKTMRKRNALPQSVPQIVLKTFER
jgi:hypothetical protein